MAPGDSAGHSNKNGLVVAHPSDTNMVTGCNLNPGLCVPWWQQEPLGINRESSCGRTKDPDVVLGSSLGPDVILVQVVAQTTWIGMAPVAPWSLDTHMASGGRQYYRPLPGPQQGQEPQTLSQAPLLFQDPRPRLRSWL